METSVCYTLMLSVAHEVTDYEFGIEWNSNSRLNSNHTKWQWLSRLTIN